MSGHLLDTGPLAAYPLGRRHVVDLVDPWVAEREAVTSILDYAEVMEYLRGCSDFTARRSCLLLLLQRVTPFSVTFDIAGRYGELRRQLRPPHGPGLIGDIDTFTAATALDLDRTLVTMHADFQRVPGLNVRLLPPRG